MPFRAKLKKTFGGKKSGENTPSGDSTPQRDDIEYYKPHEIPKSKYGGKVDPVHQEKLHAFSFTGGFGRRASSILSGAFSPRGTKSQSRRSSWMSVGGASRRKSTVGGISDDNKASRRKSMVPDQVQETEEDDEETAVGSFSKPTIPNATDPPKSHTEGTHVDEVVTGQTNKQEIQQLDADMPFTAEELEKAMTAATLKPKEEIAV